MPDDGMADGRRLGVLISGRGSNFQAIAERISRGELEAEIAVVISNRPEADGLRLARQLGIEAFCIPSKGAPREDYDRRVASELKSRRVGLVCLAGFMRLLSPVLIAEYPMRILNVHPSLLPAFPGIDAQLQALTHGVKVSGCTIHFVTEELDAGPIVMQAAVPVFDGDNEQSLSERILAREHVLYSEAIRLVLSGRYRIEGRRVLRVD